MHLFVASVTCGHRKENKSLPDGLIPISYIEQAGQLTRSTVHAALHCVCMNSFIGTCTLTQVLTISLFICTDADLYVTKVSTYI
jgi:hypothetical protein